MTGDAPVVDAGLMTAAHGGPAPGAAVAAPGAPAPAAAVNWRQEAKDIWTCVASLGFVFPSLKPVYPPETIDRLAEVWAPILERHHFDLGRFMIYFNAAIATLPIAAATFNAVRTDLRAMKAGKIAAPSSEAASDAPAAPARASDPAAGDGSEAVRPNVPLPPAGEVLEFGRPISA